MSTEWFRCSFSLFISDPLSVITLITLSCSSRYVTHRWLCVYLSLLFLRCTSACLLSGWPWWEGFKQDWWETRWFFNCGKEQKLFWWLLLLKLNQNWHTHTHVRALSQCSPVVFSLHYQPAAMAAGCSCCVKTSLYFLFHMGYQRKAEASYCD